VDPLNLKMLVRVRLHRIHLCASWNFYDYPNISLGNDIEHTEGALGHSLDEVFLLLFLRLSLLLGEEALESISLALILAFSSGRRLDVCKLRWCCLLIVLVYAVSDIGRNTRA